MREVLRDTPRVGSTEVSSWTLLSRRAVGRRAELHNRVKRLVWSPPLQSSERDPQGTPGLWR